jgi:serine/threonine-protein kinase
MGQKVRIGDYRIEQELEVTPFVASFLGVHSVLPRHAVIKVAQTQHDSVAVLREACLLAALPHPGIPSVYETGRLVDSRTWFAAELVEGPPLDALEPDVALAMIRDVAAILAHAHQRGVIHCAITPERLVVAPGRGFQMCVTEWSSARAHDAAGVYSVEPTPYTAPELAIGDAVDDRADVFALGVVAYRTLTGVMPAKQHVLTEVYCPELPREITGLVDQMLSFDRWDRPSAAEVCAELAKPITHEVVRIRRPRWTPQIDLRTKLRFDTEPSLDPLDDGDS